MGIEPQQQEGKAIYPLQLECHNSSCLCTKQFKGKMEVDLIQGNKEQQNSKCKSVPILYSARGQDKSFSLIGNNGPGFMGSLNPLSPSMVMIML